MSIRVRRTSELLRIDIHRLVTNGYWSANIGDYKVRLSPECIGGQHYLVLDVNNCRLPKRWLLSSIPIIGRLKYIPWDKSEVWYVQSSTNPHRRFRFLYINARTMDIGTRDEHCARFPYNCFSERQRIRYREYLAVRK